MPASVIVNNSEELDVVQSGSTEVPIPPAEWQVTSASSPVVKWRAVDSSLRYSNAALTSYTTPGMINSGSVTSPEVAVTESNKVFNFELMLDIETAPTYDLFSLEILIEPDWLPVLTLDKSSFAVEGTSYLPYAIDLSSYLGSNIKFRFLFDTVDSVENSTTGIGVRNPKLQGDGPTTSFLSDFKLSNRAIFSKSFVLSEDRISIAPGVRLKVTPLTPGGEYTLNFKADGLADSDDFTVPVGVENPAGETIALTMPREHGVLEALTFAVGKELQNTWGRPATRTTANYSPGDEVLQVGSTLGFPSSGYISVDGVLIQYTEKADTAFLIGDYRYVSFSRGSIVTSDVKSVEAGSRTFLLPDE